MLAIQMVECIEILHEHGILHRDIKPANFCMGVGHNSDRVYIVDLGLARQYLDVATGQHIPCATRRAVMGTVQYTSLNVQNHIQPSRRDDLESLGYVLMSFLRGSLPWGDIDSKCKKTRNEEIRFRKAWTKHADLCMGFPQEFIKFFHHCRSLQFVSRPDYELLRSLMREVLRKEQIRNDLRFDWVDSSKALRPLQCPTGDNDPLR